MTVAEFKAAFPAFADVDSDVVDRHIAASDPFFDTARWENLLDEGLGNFIAHRIVIERRNQAMGVSSGTGDVVSRSQGTTAGQVSMSRSPELAAMQFREPFNATEYGRRYLKLRSIMGSGAMAV